MNNICMGVNLSKLIEKEEVSIDDLIGKKLGIDSYNMLYQFLASIRGPDGLPLADSHGQVTSHLTGLFYRTINLVEKGLKPVYVFDGKPSQLKSQTLEKRRSVRTDAEKRSSQALQEGKLTEAKKMGSRALRLTKDMVEEAKELLDVLGIPVVEAPQEGEAQASVMNAKGLIDGVISQDFDCLLFGAKHHYRHVGFSGKRKVPGKNFYVDIKPEHIDSEKVFEQLGINREKLIWLGILVGTDFNDKFPKVGPKTAFKLVKENDSFEKIIESTGHELEFDYNEIVDVFMNPVSKEVKEDELKEEMPNKEKILEFLVEKHDFSKDRVGNTLNKYITNREEKEKQKGLNEWF
jgi:flap endonuclease-1